jgi:hypothetical protein
MPHSSPTEGAAMPDLLAGILAAAPPGTEIRIAIRLPGPSRAAPAEPVCDATPEWTLEQVIEWVRRHHSEKGLKIGEWASLLRRFGVPRAELERAARAGDLQVMEKGRQRDHAAMMATAESMAAYLEARPARVRRGRAAP